MNNSKRIADDLRALICNGTLVDGQLPTENKLMDAYQVSRYTVRKATEELQKQGLVYKVQGGGTFVNANRRKKPVSHTIGMLMSDELAADGLMSAISTAFFKRNLAVFAVQTHNAPQAEYDALRTFQKLNADAILIEPSRSVVNTQSVAILTELQATGTFPLFAFSSYPSFPSPLFSLADADSESAITSAVISMGHRRLLGVFQADDMRSVLRMNGFIRAYQQHPEVSLNSNIETYQSAEEMEIVIDRLRAHFVDVDDERRSTAVIVHNDRMALLIMDMLHHEGICVPEEVSVVGFGDTTESILSTPSLATVAFDKAAFASTIVQQTLLAISGCRPVSRQFPAHLLQRESLASRA